jgi:4-hydroxybenzoate polyprenyltransferase
LLYSVRLKQQVVVDVLMLAGLYTLRVIAGAALIAVVPSFWLLLLSMFLFLSLALVKRFAELRDAVQQRSSHAPGRGYIADDLPVLLTLGAASGLMAVLVLALYIHDPATNSIYPSPLFLWAVPPLLLYWVSRLWMKAHRGEIHDDPVVFAARDWQSLLVVGLSGLAFSMAASTAIPT